MKSYVIDANVLFSALISGRQQHLDFLAINKVYSVDFAFIELEKYRQVIAKKSKLKGDAFFAYSLQLFSNLIILPSLAISDHSFGQAWALCQNIDEKDVLYIALTVELGDSTMVTRDKALFTGLKQKGFDRIVLFQDVAFQVP